MSARAIFANDGRVPRGKRNAPRLVLRRLIWLLALCCLAGLASEGRADRRERSRPMLVSGAAAPTATVWQLRFAQANGRLTLFAAGADKVVRMWSIEEQIGVGGAGKVELREAGKITWNVYRELVGAIYAMDVVSDQQGTRMAFGGFGRKASQVNLLYAHDPDQAVSLLDRDLLDPSQVVKSLDLHYDSAAGCCWLAVAHHGKPYVPIWRVSRGDAEKSTETLFGKVQWPALSGVRHVAFRDDGAQLAVGGVRRGGGSAVAIFDVSDKTNLAGGTPVAQQDFDTPITAITWCGKALVVGTEPVKVGAEIRGGFSVLGGISRVGTEERFQRHRVYALASLDSDALVIANSDLGATHPEKGHDVHVLNLKTGAAQRLSGDSPFVEAATAVAASPDGRWIAATGLAREAIAEGEPPVPVVQIGLWKRDAAGVYRPAAKIPEKDAPHIVAPIAKIALGLDEAKQTVLGFTWGSWNNRPEREIKRGYHLAAGEIIPWSLPQPQNEVYKIQRKRKADGTIFDALQNRADGTWVGPINGSDKGRALCYAWVGNKLLAVGYDYGILLWDWDKLEALHKASAASTSSAIVRSFYGHTQQVNCLAAAPDGSWLISGSQDGTICAWSLKDLPARAQGGEMGVVLQWTGRAYRVDGDPAPGSPALEAGFTRGQEIRRFVVRGQEMASLDGVLEPLGRDRYRFKTPPGDTVEVDATAADKQSQRLLSRCSRDPLWTFYPLRNGQWYLHTPEGFYAKSSADVDIGWLVNQSGSQDIEQERGGALDRRLGASLLQPELIFRETLSLNRLAETTKAADGTLKRPTLVADFLSSGKAIDAFLAEEELPNPLAGRPSRPLFRYSFPKNGSDGLVVRVEADAGADSLAPLELRLNGWHVPGQKRLGATGVEAVVTPDMLRSAGANELIAIATVISRDPATKRERRYHFPDFYRLRLPPGGERRKPTVHFLGIGNGSVFAMGADGKRARVPGYSLPDCAGDVERIKKALDGIIPVVPGITPYREYLSEARATKLAFQEELKKLQSKLSPDDLAVIMLAGHGCSDKLSPETFAFIAYDALIESAAELAAARDKTGRSTGITGEELASWLAELNCRTCLVLDTCHSGAAPTAQQLDDQASLSIGPIIIASCGRGEESFSNQELLGGGLFTAAMVKAWELRKTKPRLTLGEWLQAVRTQCETLRKTYLPTKRQTPQVVPSRTFLGYENFTLE